MSQAKDGGISPELGEMLSKMQAYKPKDALYIPTGGLYIFEDGKKQMMAVTTTGRYSFTGGSVVDILRKTQVYSVDDIRKTYFLGLKDSPFPLSSVASIPLGNPELNRQAAVFISLDCKGCEEIVKKFFDQRDKYRVDLVLIPTPGEAKNKLRQLWCSKIKGKINDFDIVRWLSGEKKEVDKRLLSLEESQQCSVEPIVASLFLASVYNIQGVPSVVREDGLVGNGIPNDFGAWIKQSVSPLLSNPFATK
ncbi:Thiol:disulfide involved in conjugative transfer [Enterobacter hormaechei]|nr:DsbC family protein [Leclercia adecarboxylata]VAE21393.1 Thiol:disulfide involved in conjugative transfer [Enterobacter hormaechei]VAE27007.1 Thiol:disulfide involved in conjugative transfer [Enterobacter hormaechei]